MEERYERKEKKRTGNKYRLAFKIQTTHENEKTIIIKVVKMFPLV